MYWIRGLMFGLFFPAGVGLVWRLLTTPVLAYQLLAATLVLLLLEQAHMAAVDLHNIVRLKSVTTDARLQVFGIITGLTIGLELVGFYLAYFHLGWGTILVIVSQLFFNLAVPIQLLPEGEPPIVTQGVGERIPVLVANGVGVGVLGLWMVGKGAIAMAAILLGLVLVYGGVKYWRDW
jgi:hypothetical protein